VSIGDNVKIGQLFRVFPILAEDPYYEINCIPHTHNPLVLKDCKIVFRERNSTTFFSEEVSLRVAEWFKLLLLSEYRD
jgi:hypothetical protein